MRIEHQLRQRPMQPHHRPLHHHEPRPRKPPRGLEVEPGTGGWNLMVLKRLEGEVPRVSPAADLDVRGLVRPVGHVLERQVREPEKKLAQRRIRRRRLGLEARDLVLLLGDEHAQPLEPRLVAARPGRTHLAARGVALGKCCLGGGDAGAADLVEGEDLRRGRRQAAAGERVVEGVRCLPDLADVVHGASGVLRTGLWPRRRRKGSRQSGTASARSLRSSALARSGRDRGRAALPRRHGARRGEKDPAGSGMPPHPRA